VSEFKALLQVDFPLVLSSILVIFAGFKGIITLLEWVADKTGLEFKWLRKKREDHELLIRTANELVELRNQRNVDVEESIKHDEAIRKDLSELKEMFINREIDTMRWSILNFSIDISSGKKVTRESFDYVLKIHDKYERLLAENGLENGLVNESIRYIREKYHEELKNGVF
jgi:hypothetical protein